MKLLPFLYKNNPSIPSGFRWKLAFFLYQWPSPKLHLKASPGSHSSLKDTEELNYHGKSEGHRSYAVGNLARYLFPLEKEETEVAETYFSWNSRAVHVFKGLFRNTVCQEEENFHRFKLNSLLLRGTKQQSFLSVVTLICKATQDHRFWSPSLSALLS